MKKPRCGAKTRRGTPCQASAIWSTRSRRYTRCKNHGGLSTGPKTAEGIERIRQARTIHGRYSASSNNGMLGGKGGVSTADSVQTKQQPHGRRVPHAAGSLFE